MHINRNDRCIMPLFFSQLTTVDKWFPLCLLVSFFTDNPSFPVLHVVFGLSLERFVELLRSDLWVHSMRSRRTDVYSKWQSQTPQRCGRPTRGTSPKTTPPTPRWRRRAASGRRCTRCKSKCGARRGRRWSCGTRMPPRGTSRPSRRKRAAGRPGTASRKGGRAWRGWCRRVP